MSEEYYKVNDSIHINKGKILNNKFFSGVRLSLAGQWMILNQEEVKRKIRQELSTEYGMDIDDCFEYGITYFLTNKEKAFRKNYHGKDGTYNLKNYILGRNLKFMVRSYESEVKKKSRYLEEIVTGTDKDSFGSRGILEDRNLDYSNDDENKHNFGVNDEYLDNLYIILLDIFEKELRLDNYVEKFDTKQVFDHLFLIDMYDGLDKHIMNIETKVGISSGSIQLILEELAEGVKNKNEKLIRLKEGILELITEKELGWKIPELQQVK